MDLMAEYDAAIRRGEIIEDSAQRKIITTFQRLADGLKKPRTWWNKWFRKNTIQGIYLYGPVGVGKTYLIDLFYQHIEEQHKARFHFHHFMQQIDARLRQLQGKKNPIRHIAKNMAKKIHILCFDEFLVNDVAYAMILKELLQQLVTRDVILLISSNTHPDKLYWKGVHRDRFLPAIALIKSCCELITLNKEWDYRLGRKPLLTAYFHPLNQETQRAMTEQFAQLAQPLEKNGTITLQNREVPFIERGPLAIWFAFNVICNLPRSSLDYLELADRFDTVFVSDIPQLTESNTAQTILFIHFIDVMYDRGINVIISAAVPTVSLYEKGEMQETFKRTLSRLMEMQSVDYLKRHPHRKMEFL